MACGLYPYSDEHELHLCDTCKHTPIENPDLPCELEAGCFNTMWHSKETAKCLWEPRDE